MVTLLEKAEWQNLNNDLEIIEFDNIISLHKILESEQQKEIENVFNNCRVIMWNDRFKRLRQGL